MSETEEPHDILAAEEFSIPARENSIPGDPTGLREPHDVLAAEEFPMPAGAEPHDASGTGPGLRAFLPLALAALILVLVVRRRR